jgi:hypothetical protein
VTVSQATGTNLHIVCDSGCSSSAGFGDNSAFSFGVTPVNPLAGVLDDTATNAATENSAAVARITAQKALHTNLRNNAGTEVGTAAAPLRMDPTGTTTQPVSDAGGSLTVDDGNTTLSVDDGGGTLSIDDGGGSITVDGTVSISGTVTIDSELAAAVASADNLAGPTAPWVLSANMCWDSTGSNWDRCPPSTAGSGATDSNTTRVTIATDDGVATGIGRINTNMAVAHDAVDAGNPLKVGYKADSALSDNTLVAAGDRTDALGDLDGALLVRPYGPLADKVNATVGITDGSSTSLVAAQGAGVRFCATTIVVSNSSATNVTVDIRDGTAGSVLMTIPAAANMGGAAVALPAPLCTTANTALAADPSAAATTVNISAVGFKTKL